MNEQKEEEIIAQGSGVGKGDFTFHLEDEDAPILKIAENGDFFVRGNLVTNDLEVYKAFKEWTEKASIK